MRRTAAACITSIVLLASLAGPTLAAKSEHLRGHFVGVVCDGASGGTAADASFETSDAFGQDGFLAIWDGIDPDTDDPNAFAEGGDVTAVEGEGTLGGSVTFQVTNEGGDDLGTATLTVSLVAVGEPELGSRDKNGNALVRVRQVDQAYEGTGTLAFDGSEIPLTCEGDVADFSGFQNSPDSIVFENAGLQTECELEVDGNDIGAFTINDRFGFFASTAIEGEGIEAFGGSEDGTYDLSSISWTQDLFDFAGGGDITGTFAASLTPWGGRVTSWITHDDSQEKLVQQGFHITGTYTLSTGEVLTVDDEACDAEQFSFHRSESFSTKTGSVSAPANDLPSGAVALKLGKGLNAQTGGAALEAEVPIETCPQGEGDNLGHTVWYTFTGTGNPVTVDTAGSGFDSLVAVYTRSGDTFTEVACEDDVEGEPVGVSLQAALTVATQAGVTYWIEAGGFRRFDSEVAESGRLRIIVR